MFICVQFNWVVKKNKYMKKQIHMILSGHLEKQAFQMSRPLKKVIIVLVEGETEEILLKERLREIFSKHQIHFDVQRGDLFF